MYDRDEIKERADFQAIAGEFGITVGKRSGHRIQMLCPAHDDKNFGSCFWDEAKNRFTCYACHATGNIIDLVAYTLGGNTPENGGKAIRLIGDLIGLQEKEAERTTETVPLLKNAEFQILGLENEPKRRIEIEDEEYDETVLYIPPQYTSLQKECKEMYVKLLAEAFRKRKEETICRLMAFTNNKIECEMRNDQTGAGLFQAHLTDIQKRLSELDSLEKKYPGIFKKSA